MRPSDFIRKITTEWQMLLRSLRPSRATTRTRPSASSQPPSEPLLSAPSVARYEWQKYTNQPFQSPDGGIANRHQYSVEVPNTWAHPQSRPHVYDWAMDEPVTMGELAAELRAQGFPVKTIDRDEAWAALQPLVPGKSWRDELCGWPYVDPELHAKLNEGGC